MPDFLYNPLKDKSPQPSLPKSPVDGIVAEIDERLSPAFIEGVRKLLEGAPKKASLTTAPLDKNWGLPNGSLEFYVHNDSAAYNQFLKGVAASKDSAYPENRIGVVLEGPIAKVISEITKLDRDLRGAAIEALARHCGLERLADMAEFQKHAGNDYPEHNPLHSPVRQTLGDVWSRRLERLLA